MNAITRLSILLPIAAHATQVFWDGGSGTGSWAHPVNWNITLPVPLTNDELFFPSGVPVVGLSNDLSAANSEIRRLTFSGPGYTLSGNPVFLSSTVDTPLINSTHATGATTLFASVVLLEPARLSSKAGGNLVLWSASTVSLGAHTATLDAGGTLTAGGAIALLGPVTGTGGLILTGPGQVVMDGPAKEYGGNTRVDAGSLTLGAAGALNNSTVMVEAGGTLEGKGLVHSAAVSGMLAPGSSGLGRLTVKNPVLFQNTSTATLQLHLGAATTAGTTYDQLLCQGDVDIGANSNLALVPTVDFAPAIGQSFILLDKASSGSINGQFYKAEHGAILVVGGRRLQLNYRGGDGNDLVATALNNAPTFVTSFANVALAEDGNPNAILFDVDDVDTGAAAVTVNGTSSNQALVKNSNITVSGTGATRKLSYSLQPDASGTCSITLTASDGTDSTTASFSLTVIPVNDAPTLGRIVESGALEMSPDSTLGPIPFTVDDLETDPALLTLQPSSDSPSVVPPGNLVFGGSGANRTLTVTPLPGMSGTVRLEVLVSDGNLSDRESFTLVVRPLQTFEPVVVDRGSPGEIRTTNLAVVDGMPAVAYTDTGVGRIKFARCSVTDGSGAWLVQTLPFDVISVFRGLAMVADRPALAAIHGGDAVLLRNSLANGAGDWTRQQAYDGSSSSGEQRPSFAVVNGKPAMAMVDFEKKYLWYLQNSMADGSGIWTSSLVFVTLTHQIDYEVCLAEVDGRPMISYCTEGLLTVARGGSADGSSFSWSDVTVDSFANNPSLAVVAGRPAISYRVNFNGGELMFARSCLADGSGCWNTTTVDTGGENGVGLHSSLADVGGKPAISYYDETDGNLKFARNENASGTGEWTCSTIYSGGVGGDVGLETSLAVVEGKPAISFADKKLNRVQFIRNSEADGSGTWLMRNVAHADGNAGSTGTTQALIGGYPSVAYVDFFGILKFSRNDALDGSGTWRDSIVRDDFGIVYVGPDSLREVEGVPAIVYTRLGELIFTRNAQANGLGVWSEFPVASGVSTRPSFAEVAGAPAVSYKNESTKFLTFSRCASPSGLAAWTAQVVDPATEAADDSSLSLVAGCPAICYRTSPIVGLNFARNTAADGSGTWIVQDVDSSFGAGYGCSLTVVDGRPAVSYITSGGLLKFARNSAADASGSWNIQTVDDPGFGYSASSLRVLRGRPVISYYDRTNKSLKYAMNTQRDGSGAWLMETLDSSGDAGQFPSLDILTRSASVPGGPPVPDFVEDDLPAVSYYDALQGDVKWVAVKPPNLRVQHPQGTNLSFSDSVDFAPVAPGAQAVERIYFRNEGPSTLYIEGFALGGAAHSYFQVDNSGTQTILTAGQTTHVDVTYAPSSGGNHAATLSLISPSLGDGSRIIPLEAQAVDTTPPTGGTISLSPSVGVDPGANLSVSFDGWADPAAPLAYEVRISDIVVSPSGPTSVRSVAVPVLPGTYVLKGRITDGSGNTTVVARNFNVNTPVESWRFLHFGATANSGDSADGFDFEGDGLVNLAEYAFGLSPKLADAAQLPDGRLDGSHFEVRFTPPVGVSGIVYGAEWCPTISPNPLDWTNIPDTGVPPERVFRVPVAEEKTLYLRLRITAPE